MTAFCYKLFLIKINLHFLLFHLSAAKATYTCSTHISSDALMLDVLFLLYHTVAARGYLPSVANVFVAAPTPAIRQYLQLIYSYGYNDGIIVDCEQYAKLGM